MDSILQITLLANAGLLLEYQGCKILLDGLFDKSGNLFTAPHPEILQQLIQGQGEFSDIACVLISHTHEDHFSADVLKEYLARQQPKEIFLPATALQKHPELWHLISEKQVACVPLTPGESAAAFHTADNIIIRPISTRHLDAVFQDVDHFCYLVSFDGKSVLFTADADYTKDSFPILRNTELSAVFLNPLFYHALCNGAHCKSVLHTEKFCIYHVPAENNDPYRMRTMLHKDVAKCSASETFSIILDDPGQKIRLSL